MELRGSVSLKSRMVLMGYSQGRDRVNWPYTIGLGDIFLSCSRPSDDCARKKTSPAPSTDK